MVGDDSGVDDESVACRADRCTGSQCQCGRIRVGGGDDFRVFLRADDELVADFVDESSRQCVDLDAVACREVIQVVEGRAVCGAVAGDGGVAQLARHRSFGKVSWALLEVGRVDALHDGPLEADGGYAQDGDGRALGICCVRCDQQSGCRAG